MRDARGICFSAHAGEKVAEVVSIEQIALCVVVVKNLHGE